jgi:hypothetical protein
MYVFENRPKRDFSFPLADVPIPENVKNFKSITIRFVVFAQLCLNKLNYYSEITANPAALFCKNFSLIPC